MIELLLLNIDQSLLFIDLVWFGCYILRLFTCIDQDQILEILPAVSSFWFPLEKLLLSGILKSFCMRASAPGCCLPPSSWALLLRPPASICLIQHHRALPSGGALRNFLRRVHFVSAAPFLHLPPTTEVSFSAHVLSACSPTYLSLSADALAATHMCAI